MRFATLGNGRLALTLDNRLLLRELYFPVVGLTNHAAETGGSAILSRTEGNITRLGGEDWIVQGSYGNRMSFLWKLKHESGRLNATIHETIHSERPIWRRLMK